MLISEKVFWLIEKNGMTQKEFADKTGISQSTISDWKRKKTNPSADKILKICEVLQVTPYELLAEGSSDTAEKKDYFRALNQEEESLLEGFRTLEEKQKERVLGYLAALQNK